MRHGRAKAARRTLQFLARTQNYKLPYNVLLDGTFCVAAMRMKIPLRDRLCKLLQQQHDENDKVRLHVTKSTLEELKALADSATKHQEYFQEAYAWVQNAAQEVVRSNEPSAVKDTFTDPALSATAQDILQTLTSDAEHALKYFLASQDDQLLHAARNCAVPCLRLQRTVLLLEQPSKVAELQDRGLEKRKWKGAVPEQEKHLVSMVRSEQKQMQQASAPQASRLQQQQRAKKKAKGPNPLSCKRKKSGGESGESKKRVKT
ncbi:hypothetical protein MPSEU_000219800 [Mayamaea pseudoterrestris]|nr:hypothetical protein MPSEU_000219800 [Mayamaea pseudoterrestris]